MNLVDLTLIQAKKDLKNKKYSSAELTKSCLRNIKEYDGKLNAFITVNNTQALKQADEADQKLAGGKNLPLLGIPIALKDLFVTNGLRTTAGSNVLKDYIGQYDGTVVKKLKEAGAVIIGKTNCDAWAHGSSGENSDFGPTKNPYDPNFIPGGSSSGSPVALAAGMCLASTGTDTGGSIRLPASFCNVVGIKPTYGRVSRYGIISMASSLDTIGHFTKTVEDSALLLGITAGNDPLDATTPPVTVPDYLLDIKNGIKNLRIGFSSDFSKGLSPEMKKIYEKTLKNYESLGGRIVEVSMPNAEYAIAVYYLIQTAEVSSNLARYDGIRYGLTRKNFGAEAKRRILIGTFVLSAGYYDAYYKKAMQVRTLIKQDFENAFKKCDVIVTPTSSTPPWKLGEKITDPLQMYLSDILTVSANLSGVPGISLPAGFINPSASSGQATLPVGMQILGPHFSEELLYKVGYAYQEAHPIWKEAPKL